MYERKDIMKFKRIASIALSATLAFSILSQSSLAYIINEERKEEYLASGVHRAHIERFTSEGWQNLNVLTIDTTNQMNEIKAIFNTEGVSHRSNVRDMVNVSGAIAGVNGDYFNYQPHPSTLGMIVNDGKLISSAQEGKNKLPVFYQSSAGDSQLGYIDQSVDILNQLTGAKYHVSGFNKAYGGYKYLSLLTRDWGRKSFGAKAANMTEVLVENGVVADIRTNGEPFDIPEDGYVLSQNNSPLASLTLGTPLELQVTSNVDYKGLKFAMGGGSIILKNGVAMQTNIVNKGRHPRTGIGVTQDGSKIVIITVDGRNGYAGLTQKEFGEIFKSFGCYNAMNLDGGGSTTMVKKTKAMDKAEIINKPSGGTPRAVVSGVGVFSSDNPGAVARIELDLDTDKAFPGVPVAYSVKAYDASNNPVRVDVNAVSASATNGASCANGSFIGVAEGTSQVTVSYQGASDTKNIEVFSEPVELRSSTEKINAKPGDKFTIKDIIGLDNQGRSAKIPNSSINFSIWGTVGAMNGNVFTASNNIGYGYITMGYKNTYKNIPVTIGFISKPLLDFENLNNIKASSFPADKVSSSLKISKVAKQGSGAVELNYDFSKLDDSRAAFISFKKAPVLEGKPKRLGMWVKGDAKGAMLKATIKDSEGFAEQITFSEKINFNDYRYLEAEVPDNEAYPYTLLNIYVGSSNNSAMVKSKILVDAIDLLYEHKFENAIDNSSVLADGQNGFVQKTSGGEYLVVSGYDANQDKNFEGAKTAIINKVNKVDTSILLNNYDNDFKKAVSKNLLKNANVFSTSATANAFILNLNTKKRSLRLSDANEWSYITSNLKNVTQNNIVVTMTSPVFGKGGFTDKKEAALLHAKLKELAEMGKNVYVVAGSNETSVKMLDKVRYINVFNKPIKTKADLVKRSYVQFTFNLNASAYIVTNY